MSLMSNAHHPSLPNFEPFKSRLREAGFTMGQIQTPSDFGEVWIQVRFWI